MKQNFLMLTFLLSTLIAFAAHADPVYMCRPTQVLYEYEPYGCSSSLEALAPQHACHLVVIRECYNGTRKQDGTFCVDSKQHCLEVADRYRD